MLLSEELWYKICRFHQIFGDTEWSGPIWYEMKGSIDRPDKLVLEVKHLMLKDVGSAAYTEYEFGEEMIDFYEKYPELMGVGDDVIKMGHLHTHHNMNAFFSGTDMKALHDGADSLDMILSVIVNRHGMKIAKIAMVTESETKTFFTHMKKVFSFNSQKKEVLSILDCDVVIENEGRFNEEIESVINQKKAKKAKLEAEAQKRRSEQFKELPAKITQLDMFDEQTKREMIEIVKQRGEEVDNEILLNDEAIENLIVRSIAHDDTVSGDLKTAVDIMEDMIKEVDFNVELRQIVTHFYDSLQNEYYYDQFEFVINRSISLMGKYRDDSRLVNNFCLKLEYWLDEFLGSTGSESGMDIGVSFEQLNDGLGDSRDRFSYQKNQIANEF